IRIEGARKGNKYYVAEISAEGAVADRQSDQGREALVEICRWADLHDIQLRVDPNAFARRSGGFGHLAGELPGLGFVANEANPGTLLREPRSIEANRPSEEAAVAASREAGEDGGLPSPGAVV